MNYILPFLPEIEKPKNQKVKYTIEIHRALYTEELFELYQKYEKAVHNRDVTQE